MSLSRYTERNHLENRHHNPDTLAREGQRGGQASEQKRLEGLKTVTSLIERLAQETSWQEIYQLVTQVGEILGKNYNDAEPKESVVSRFRQAIDRVKRAVNAQESWTTSISLSRLVRLFAIIVLSLHLTAPVSAAGSKQNILDPYVQAALVDSSGLGSQDGTVFSLSRIADAEAPDNQPEAEGFDLEESLEILDQHGYLDDLLMQLMIAIESDSQKEVGFSNIFIQSEKQDGKTLINYSGIFSGGLRFNEDDNLEFVNNYGTTIDRAIGIVVPKIPYMMYINKNTPQERIQFFSGVTHWFGHCCGTDPNYRVFANFEDLRDGDRVEITTNDQQTYPFLVRSVGNTPADDSLGMVYSNHNDALRFIASVLLSTPKEPASEDILNQVEAIVDGSQNVSSAIGSLQKLLNENGINENLERILRTFIDGRAMILMTCDPEAVIRTSTGLQSAGRVVAIVELEPGQEPPEFLRPAVFLNPPDKELDNEFAKRIIQALHQRYPSIVTQWVQRFMESIPQSTETPQPIATVSTTSTSVPASTSGSNSDTKSIRQDDTQPSPQPQPSEKERIQKQIQERIARLQWLNAQVESVLPPFPIIPQSPNLIDLNGFTNDVVLGNSASLIELTQFFLSKPESLAALQEYIQILESLTSAPQGENVQHLQNLIYKLKLVKFSVENYQIIGGVLVVVVVVGVGVLLSLALARRRGRG